MPERRPTDGRRMNSTDVITALKEQVGQLKSEMEDLKKLMLESNRLLALLTVEIQTANRRMNPALPAEMVQTSGGGVE